MWHTNNPDFSECFHQTALVWIPCCFMCMFAPYEVHNIRSSKDRYIPWSLVNVTKTVIASDSEIPPSRLA